MSSLSNVNQKLGVQNLLKSMKNGQAQKAGLSSKVPSHMTENGSVFAANNSTVSVNPTPAVGGKAPTSKSQMDESIFNAGATSRGAASASVYSTSQSTSSSNVGATSSVQNSNGTASTTQSQGKKYEGDLDLSQYDFDNLTGVPDGDLKALKDELTELKDSDIPRFLENSVNQKLRKVNSEMQKRISGTNTENENAQQTSSSDKKQDVSTSDGASATSGANEGTDNTKVVTKQSEENTSKMESAQKDAQALDKKIQKDDAKFKKQVKADEKAIQKEQKQIEKETEKVNQIASKLEAENAKIEEQNAKMESDSISEQEQDDSIALMGESNTKMQQLHSELGKGRSKISKLTVSSNKRVRALSRSAKNHKAVSVRQQKQMKQELSTADKVLKAAQTAEQISNYTIMAGNMAKSVGGIMVEVGTPLVPNPFTAALGSALCTGGGIAIDAGVVANNVGRIGVAVSAGTQAATHAAQGNMKGALTSGLRAATAAASAAGASNGLQKGIQGASKVANAAFKNAESVKTTEANTVKKQVKPNAARAQRRGNA